MPIQLWELVRTTLRRRRRSKSLIDSLPGSSAAAARKHFSGVLKFAVHDAQTPNRSGPAVGTALRDEEDHHGLTVLRGPLTSLSISQLSGRSGRREGGIQTQVAGNAS
jgi:hypothetical protein